MRSLILVEAWPRLAGQVVSRVVGRVVGRPRTAVFTLVLLAVGVGLPTAMFSLIDGVLLRGLPLPEGDRIVRVTTQGGFDSAVPAGDFQALADAVEAQGREEHPALDGLAGGLSLNTVVTRQGLGSKGMTGTYVTANMFPMLGVEPVLGRSFTAEDARPDAPGVVIISHRLWRQWFGGDPEVLGETVVVNREPMTVVGVMPAGFQFPVRQEVWTPLRREGWWAEAAVFPVGRLAPGVDVEGAERALAPVAVRLDEERPLPKHQSGGRRVGVVPFVRALVPPEVGRSLRLMLWAVLGVLLIACGNVASLRLGDTLARSRDLAVRRALGARASQLLRPLLAETAVLTAAGAAAGAGLAWLLLRGASATVLEGSMMERLFWVDVRLDGRACAFAVAAGVAAALLGTLPPALWSVARRDLSLGFGGMATRGISGSGGRGGLRLAGLLVVAQVAVCFVLVSASVLLVGSARSLLVSEPGFDPDGLLRVMVNPYQASWTGPEEPRAFWRRLLPRLAADPAVAGATLASGVPWGSQRGVVGVGVAAGERLAAGEGSDAGAAPEAGPRTLPRAGLLRVLPGFFDTLRLPILAGRAFESRDVEMLQGSWAGDAAAESPRELPVVVSAGFALHYLGRRPLGEPVELVPRGGDRAPIRCRVVGVAADRGVLPRDWDASADTVYLPLSVGNGGGGFLIVRGRPSTAGAPASSAARDDLLRRIDRAIGGVDPLVATLDPATYQEDRAEVFWVERRLAQLFSLFAAASLVLSGFGLFGVAVLSFRRRLRELAIRSALGARPVHLRTLLLRQGASWIGLGLAGGAGLAWVTHRLLRTFLHGVAPWDPALAAASAALVTLALLAAVTGPARRAARTDPAKVLDAE